ncbi:Oleate activated transcription factor 3 [Colletotrichum fructicola]|nr:Oleate activated transcription factor 3 [Colletotrichum fructicola]
MDSRTARERANVVCVECHSRKVKCDLQGSPDNKCRNCRRSGVQCMQDCPILPKLLQGEMLTAWLLQSTRWR